MKKYVADISIKKYICYIYVHRAKLYFNERFTVAFALLILKSINLKIKNV
jgi:hypothetical protein